MIENLKKALKDDIWKIIDNEDPIERRDMDFFEFIFYLLLENKSFLLNDVVLLAKELKDTYNRILKETEEKIINSNGNLIRVLKNVDKDFDEELKPLVNKLKRMIKNARN